MIQSLSKSGEYFEDVRKKEVKAYLTDTYDTFSTGKPTIYSRNWQQNFAKIVINFTN